MKDFTRREFVCAGVATLAAVAARPVTGWAADPRARPMRGAFMILTTPFTAAGEVDWADLAHEAACVDSAGAQESSGRRVRAASPISPRTSGCGAWRCWQGEPGPQGRARPRRAGQRHRRDAGVRATRAEASRPTR